MTDVAKALFEQCGVDVSSTQVYNQLRKWGQRWLIISRLHDLRSVVRGSKCIILEAEHYHGDVADHPRYAEFLNVPIANYDEMHAIFSFGLATGKFAMGSNEPLGTPPAAPSAEYADTRESNIVILDGPPEKPADAPEKVNAGKGKRGAFLNDELAAFTNMNVVVKDVAHAIRDNKTTHMLPDLYQAVMDIIGFTE
ncbi:hypothetical protein QYE76_055564 [Lolium multiflorum]|uniref:Uncharacterized protein n=1 Tax=Lolium multiflorum TaxID=4521 RepID=A0AAD8WPK7_LOLMU|nr:hypothetical protein QYE76_055564 [Lolium multiflorum]